MKLIEYLPNQWASWIAPAVGELNVQEVGLNCFICSASQWPQDDPDFHPADVKCCAFRPFIPNYRVRRIQSLHPTVFLTPELLPLGLVAPATFQRAVLKSPNRQNLACPFFTRDRACAIWDQRPAPCAAFFCRSQQGMLGRKFWHVLEELLIFLEQALSRLWMLEAGYEWREIEAAMAWLATDSGRDLTATEQRRLWAHHQGTQEQFFLRAEAWADSLTRLELQKWLGDELLTFTTQVLDAHRLTSWGGSPRSPL